MEKFTKTHALGNVIWPAYPILFAKNLGDLADEIHRRDLYLFDIWGYVPGSGPGGYWQQFKPSPDMFRLLEGRLGERWLGTDIGEQDGRYVGGYAEQMTPASGSRLEQYANFQRHFERMGDDLGHKHATLVSLNFGHYFLKEGTYTLIGAETAQALPNNQVYYAFIRGAGKQYGVPWFGNASIFNRWGFKTYGSTGRSDGYEHGPTKGTSLSLLKRLLYSHIFYNSVAVGFENGWFDGEQLSPIGRIQQAAQRWIQENGQPGVMQTPVALLLDFHAGWTFPRHLYTDKVYRVWGNLPYEAGDYFTDAVLDLLYPGYQDSSYFHDESGFITATPYGDMVDCLLSDAPGWLLDRYSVVVLAGRVAGGVELGQKLERYLENGGHLILTSGNLARFPGGLAGQSNVVREVVVRHGKGKLTLLPSEFGINLEPPLETALKSQTDHPLPKPYALRPEVRQALNDTFRSQALFDVGNPALSFITCRRGPSEYRLCIANNSWRELPFRIESRCGVISSIQELPLDSSEKAAVGYLPESIPSNPPNLISTHVIAGGDVRVFAVHLSESNVAEIPHLAPPPNPRRRFLTLRDVRSIKEELLRRPTFFEHFDGVMVDWKYLHEREKAAVQQESGWIRRQGLNVAVDLSSGINLYPTLRMIDNSPEDYAASLAAIRDVLVKMALLGAHDLFLSLHRHPENNFTDVQTRAAFEKVLLQLATDAQEHGVTLQLRMAHGKPPWSLPEAVQLLEKIKAPNVRLAPSMALLPDPATAKELMDSLAPKLGSWLLATERKDQAGRTWDVHAPLAKADPTCLETVAQWLSKSPTTPIVFDAICRTLDDEFLESRALDGILNLR